MPMIRVDELPLSNIAREFVGEDHGGVGLTFLLVDAPPGAGPGLHSHPYEEIMIVQEGRGTFTLGDDRIDVGAGEIVIIPADVPHAFVNSGERPLRQIDIHVSSRFCTEWL